MSSRGWLESIRRVFRPYVEQLPNKYPRTYRLVLTLRKGTSQFTKETWEFVKIKYHMKTKGKSFVDSMTFDQIMLYQQVPKDWKKVAPVMIIASFPFLNYIILPIAYVYPDRLLCRQFWSIEQFYKFNNRRYLQKIQLYDPILKCLMEQADKKLTNDNVAKNILIDSIEQMIKKEYTDINRLIELKPILTRPEFGLSSLSEAHLAHLCNLHDSRRVFTFNKQTNLAHFAHWSRQLDDHLVPHHLNRLPVEQIYSLSFDRGINAKTYPVQDLIYYLETWLRVSSQLMPHNAQASNHTLYLHLRVFFRNFLHQMNQNKLI